MRYPWFSYLALTCALLAFCVVVLGAYVRLSDAGLGCPDWPGCYGHLTIPNTAGEIAKANSEFPDRPVEAPKAWKEMAHRYFASTLGLLILVIAGYAWRFRRRQDLPLKLPMFLVALVIFQGLLGMLTVTLLLKPFIVLLHLLGGMATLALLWLLFLRSTNLFAAVSGAGSKLRNFAFVGLVVVVLQIALGGWTSSNYAALACPDFPTCQTQWWPQMDFTEGFILWRGLGVDYEGGVLDNPARVAVHMAHRLGAIVTLLFIGMLSILSIAGNLPRHVKITGAFVGVFLLLQISLGISTVKFGLPLVLAAAHNGMAALLLLSLVSLSYFLRQPNQ
ncbi:MAG: COX15/CtaA family protein [Gammaproteobacteria bacterium]|nr:COX15/CtaA family protein [Gammaproteobacteria bacterium]